MSAKFLFEPDESQVELAAKIAVNRKAEVCRTAEGKRNLKRSVEERTRETGGWFVVWLSCVGVAVK